MDKNSAAYEQMQLLTRTLYDVQQLRIAANLRRQDLVRTEKVPSDSAAVATYDGADLKLKETEELILKSVARFLKEFPIWTEWMKGVRGVGPSLAASLITAIRTPERFATISKLWAYAGMHVVDGKAPRRAKGQSANWNSWLRVTCWKLSASFVRLGVGYRELYEKYKAAELEKAKAAGIEVVYASPVERDTQQPAASLDRSDAQKQTASRYWTETHRDGASHREGDAQALPANSTIKAIVVERRARRKMVKVFLSHLWLRWRELEGLPTGKPYCEVYGGHQPVPVIER